MPPNRTDLSVTRTANAVNVLSNTGNDATIPGADETRAGVLTAEQFKKLTALPTSAELDARIRVIEEALDLVEPPPPPPAGDTAAEKFGWGTPVRQTDFTTQDGWESIDGTGHAGNGTRSKARVTYGPDGLTIEGLANGDTGWVGYDWNTERIGIRIEVQMRSDPGAENYHPILILWPQVLDWPEGGEIDYCEILDSAARQRAHLYVHDVDTGGNAGHAQIDVDCTQWHHWACEWLPGQHIKVFCDGVEWGHYDEDQRHIPTWPMVPTIQLDWVGGSITDSYMYVRSLKEYALP